MIYCYNLFLDGPVTFSDLSDVAQTLHVDLRDPKKISNLAKALKINDIEVSKLESEGYKEAYLGMAMLMKWKTSAQDKATKSKLAKILKNYGFQQFKMFLF